MTENIEQNLPIVKLDLEYNRLKTYFEFLVVESAMILLFLIVYSLSRQVQNLYKDQYQARFVATSTSTFPQRSLNGQQPPRSWERQFLYTRVSNFTIILISFFALKMI